MIFSVGLIRVLYDKNSFLEGVMIFCGTSL
jgi:hypothetical protein